MAFISRRAPVADISTVIDSPKVLVLGIAAALSGLIGLFLLYGCLAAYSGYALGFGIALLLLALAIFYRAHIVAKGYVINIPKNRFYFPGGGVAANDWTDYFKLSFLLQGFQRRQIPLMEIRYIHEYIDRSYYTDSQGRKRVSKHKMLEISGEFGAVTFEFYSKGKMNQLYSAIISLNKMGFPVSGG